MTELFAVTTDYKEHHSIHISILRNINKDGVYLKLDRRTFLKYP